MIRLCDFSTMCTLRRGQDKCAWIGLQGGRIRLPRSLQRPDELPFRADLASLASGRRPDRADMRTKTAIGRIQFP
jgi:hypothetical protein